MRHDHAQTGRLAGVAYPKVVDRALPTKNGKDEKGKRGSRTVSNEATDLARHTQPVLRIRLQIKCHVRR